jgi:hypothetical protein
VFDEGHQISLLVAEVLQIDANGVCRKREERAHVAGLSVCPDTESRLVSSVLILADSKDGGKCEDGSV